MTAIPTPPLTTAESGSRPSTLLFSAALATVALALSSTWLSFPGTWLENRSHGFVIASLCGWLLWRDRQQLDHEGAAYPPAVAAVGALSLLWLTATIVSARVVHQAVAPLLLLTWLLAVRGQRPARALAPVLGVFVVALPVWEVLTWPLQRMTTVVSGVALRAVGIEATIKDETITIPAGSLIVANTCSGLGYFMTAITIGTVYAFLYVKVWNIRLRIIGVAAAVALVANWVRVAGLGVIANATQMQSPLMKDHEAYGWWIFAAVMALYFWLLPRLEGRRTTAAPAALPLPVEVSRPPVQAAVPRTPASGGSTTAPASIGTLLLATGAALTGPLLYLLISALPVSGDAPAQVPGIVPGARWTPIGAPADSSAPWAPGFTGASEQRTAYFVRDSSIVRVDRFIYRSQHDGAELIGSGNAVAPAAALLEDRVIGPLDDQARSVRQAAVRDGQRVRLVWYWYRVAGVETPSRPKAKLLELPAFIGRHAVSEVVTLSAPCAGGDCSTTTRVLYNLATGRDMPASARP
jgi:EpsI family protein